MVGCHVASRSGLVGVNQNSRWMQWRGLTTESGCAHRSCVDFARCLFSRAPVFDSERAQKTYDRARRSYASNEAGHYHGTSLLLSWENIEEHILDCRKEFLDSLGPERAKQCREFLVNKRDAPTRAPVSLRTLSQYVDGDSSDLQMPNLEDYRRCFVGSRFGGWGRPESGLPRPPPWRKRKSCAVFRGSASGEGVSPKTNPRLLLACLSQTWASQDPAHGLLDAKLTSWNQRQKIGRDGVLRILDPEDIYRTYGLKDVGKHNYLTWEEQSQYKYAVYLDGNVGAGRLGALLGLGFVILAPPSQKPQTFLRSKLQPMLNFVPLREDLGDLWQALQWLRQNDEEAQHMSLRNLELYRLHCTRAAIERDMRGVTQSLFCLPEHSLKQALSYAWNISRCGIYVLLDDKMSLLLFAPFANPSYRNEWKGIQTEEATLQEFLLKVYRLTGEKVTLPLEAWWANAGLVCNAPVQEVWGESMLPELRLLLESLSHATGDSLQEGSKEPLGVLKNSSYTK